MLTSVQSSAYAQILITQFLYVENFVVFVRQCLVIGRHGAVGHRVVLLVESVQLQDQELATIRPRSMEDCHVLVFLQKANHVTLKHVQCVVAGADGHLGGVAA